ncbi:hypothetical protein [Salisediminibacterium halotolerans]|uniref:Uncharacterized protein n=1 Tax=Salisediminibacterium halotolerans TaxID=517425 RepID=A0A1H9RLN1_9BACI|nr:MULTISPECIES: hypothetical protein [Salisediminibacterium]RLJ77846.1 hypothetical protein BCL39_0310 [Actinophytocola xinjiangensis]RPE82807.1 hypothetical protein EDD67_2763 [Salisediminibacterium halotolerans]TWG36823.1 hypothetical protein BCL52_0309 [Salisediminibacterium halotolerans]SER73498.1 hypothetical protein SAMN05444126_1055 [Salisediminibacterium haloalkalitolerans]GEL08729.1 hypothetical protein SHA02_21450 [Salisediminibacterium halotolerans]
MKKREEERQAHLEYDMAVELMISEGGPVYEHAEKYLKRVRAEDENDDSDNKETH